LHIGIDAIAGGGHAVAMVKKSRAVRVTVSYKAWFTRVNRRLLADRRQVRAIRHGPRRLTTYVLIDLASGAAIEHFHRDAFIGFVVRLGVMRDWEEMGWPKAARSQFD
jgi:hypothetical protein